MDNQFNNLPNQLPIKGLTPPAASTTPAPPATKRKRATSKPAGKRAPASKSKQAAPAKPAPQVEPKTIHITYDDMSGKAYPLAAVIEQVGNGDVAEVDVDRKAWLGDKKASVRGVRNQLNTLGFSMDEDSKVTAASGKGRLESAVYSNGEVNLRVQYGVVPGYGHKVTKA